MENWRSTFCVAFSTVALFLLRMLTVKGMIIHELGFIFNCLAKVFNCYQCTSHILIGQITHPCLSSFFDRTVYEGSWTSTVSVISASLRLTTSNLQYGLPQQCTLTVGSSPPSLDPSTVTALYGGKYWIERATVSKEVWIWIPLT